MFLLTNQFLLHNRFTRNSFFSLFVQSLAVFSHNHRHMDRLLCHHICAGDVAQTDQPVAAQNVRQGADDVGDEPEETEQREHGQRTRQQQNSKRDVRVRRFDSIEST